METFQRVFQPGFEEFFNKDYLLKGKWAREVFMNSHPIVLELGCGKGEYTISQALRYPSLNFIGVDIKGARIWNGAKAANEQDIRNAAFLRTRIEFIRSFFDVEEIEEIWITFPDPQLKKRRNKKRLTGSIFLNQYRSILRDQGKIHLKTDNDLLYQYTREMVTFNKLEIVADTSDLYNSGIANDILKIQTYYEKKFLEKGMEIKYICFRLPAGQKIHEIPEDDG